MSSMTNSKVGLVLILSSQKGRWDMNGENMEERDGLVVN